MVQSILDPFGDFDFAFAGQQIDRAHLAHIHANGIGGATKFSIDRRNRRGGFLGRFFVDLRFVHQDGIEIRRGFVHRDPHVINHVDDVFDLFRIDNIVRQMVVDFVIRQKALLFTFRDQAL